MFAARFVLVLGVMAWSLAPAPVAADSDELPLEDYFFSFASCYGRSYSFDHLNAHPNQKVVDIVFSHYPTRQELLGLDGAFQPYPETPRFVGKVDVWLRGENESWQTDAFCEPSGDGMACGIECDGGQFRLEARDGGKLLLTGGGDLSFEQCDAGPRVLTRAPDDKSFLLSPIPRSHCRPK